METNALCRQLVRSYVSANSLESRIVVLDRRVGELTSEDLNHDEVTTTHTAFSVNHCHSYHIISYHIISLMCCVAVVRLVSCAVNTLTSGL